jgi:hypothetical protein
MNQSFRLVDNYYSNVKKSEPVTLEFRFKLHEDESVSISGK